jgi:hypothetical protein
MARSQLTSYSQTKQSLTIWSIHGRLSNQLTLDRFLVFGTLMLLQLFSIDCQSCWPGDGSDLDREWWPNYYTEWGPQGAVCILVTSCGLMN